MNFRRTQDRIAEWLRYRQPTRLERQLLGLHTDSCDILFAARAQAAQQSAEYVVKHMRTAQNLATDYDLREWAAHSVDTALLEQGLVLEFGVAAGRSIRQLARCWPTKTIHGFDSWTGLPSTWHWRLRQGAFAQQQLPRVPANVQLHQGLFEQSLEPFLAAETAPVAFVHIDCDLYTSSRVVLDSLAPRMVPGTVIVFDEYLNYPGWQQDEARAWQETVDRYQIRYEYTAFVSRHQQVAVRIVDCGVRA